MSTYMHAPLASRRSIRLLRLYPARAHNDLFRLQLSEAFLDELEPTEHAFEALSYVWGAIVGTEPIECNGKRLLVTPNCQAALRRLRLTNKDRVLWVDAICINQSQDQAGLDERNVQVPLMGEIYAKAARTICWLGEGTGFTAEVCQHLTKIGQCPSQRGLQKLKHFETQLHRDGRLAPDVSCLIHIFGHSWHNRIWTVQEVAFSNDCHVMCGSGIIPWSEYCAAAKFLIYDEFDELLDPETNRAMIGIDVRDTLKRYIAGEVQSDTDEDDDAEDRKVVFLTSCLTDVKQLASRNPKDKIYGVHALYTALGIAMAGVNYDLPLAQIFADATVAMICWSRSLRILRDASTTHRDQSLPSWVPDWNDSQTRLYIPDHEATGRSRLDNTDLHVLHSIPEHLRVRGKVVGTVGGAGVVAFPTTSSADRLSILSETVQYRDLTDPEFLRLTIERVAFLRTVYRSLQDATNSSGDPNADEVFYTLLTLGNSRGVLSDLDLFDEWTSLVTRPECAIEQLGARSLALEWKAADASNVDHWSAEILECATIAAALVLQWVKRGEEILGVTQAVFTNMSDQAIICVDCENVGQSTLGTTFNRTLMSDKVVLLKGADWPVILRRSGHAWEFIGPAHVIGLMDGEHWDVIEQLEDFVIC